MLTTGVFDDSRDYLSVRIDRTGEGLYAAMFEISVSGEAALITHSEFVCGCSSLMCGVNTALEVVGVYSALSGCGKRAQPPTMFVEGCCS